MRKPRAWRKPKPLPPHLDVHRMETSVRLSPTGEIMAIHRGHGRAPAHYIPIPAGRHVDHLMAEPHKFRVDLRSEHRLRERHRIHFSVDGRAFLADGIDMAIIAIGELPPEETEPTLLRINDQIVEVPIGDVVDIASTEPGIWVVRLADPRYYADPMTYTIRGLENTPETRAEFQRMYDDPLGKKELNGVEITPAPVGPSNRGTQRPHVTIGRST